MDSPNKKRIKVTESSSSPSYDDVIDINDNTPVYDEESPPSEPVRLTYPCTSNLLSHFLKDGKVCTRLFM